MKEADHRRQAHLDRLERLAAQLLQNAAALKAEINALRKSERGDAGWERETVSSIPDWP